MFSLFTQQLPDGGPPHHDYILRDYMQALKAIIALSKYYNNANYFVPNAHILVRLIKLLDNDYPSLDTYLRAASASMGSINIIGINTAYRPGTLMADPFVGGLNKCMIYAEDATSTTTTPVQVVYHPFTHVNLPLMDGIQVEKGLGSDISNVQVSTYTVSINGLMTKYKRYKDTDHSALKGPAHFVHSEILPAMMLSFYQLALFNRLWYPIAGNSVISPPSFHRLRTLNLSHSDIPLHNTVKTLRSVNIVSYADVLTWQNRRGYGLTQLGKLPPTVSVYRPTAAFAWFSRARMITGLFLLGGHNLMKRQGEYIRELNYALTITESGRFISDPIQRELLQPLFKQLVDTRNFLK